MVEHSVVVVVDVLLSSWATVRNIGTLVELKYINGQMIQGFFLRYCLYIKVCIIPQF